MIELFRIFGCINCWKRRQQRCFVGLVFSSILSVVYFLLDSSWTEENCLSTPKNCHRISGTEEKETRTGLVDAVGWNQGIGAHPRSGRMAVFWFGKDLPDFLFKGFTVHDNESFAAVCVGLTSSAILLEGLRKVRNYCYTKFVEQRKLQHAVRQRRRNSRTILRPRPTTSLVQSRSDGHDYGGAGDAGDASVSLMRSPVDEAEDLEMTEKQSGLSQVKQWIPACEKDTYKVVTILALSTLLHMVYISIGYVLMLAVMTFNVWVFVAIGMGIGIGRFFFGTEEIHEITLTEDVPGPSSGQTSSGAGDGGPSPSSTAVTSLAQESETCCLRGNGGGDAGDSGEVFPRNALQQHTADVIVHPRV